MGFFWRIYSNDFKSHFLFKLCAEPTDKRFMRTSSRALSVKALVTLSFSFLVSCSIPFFGKGSSVSSDEHVQKLSTLSGVLEYKEGCGPGYYKVILKGLFENSGVDVQSQTDSLGKFTLKAPPGRYLAQVMRDGCGSKENVTLERNTEHMISFVVQDSGSVEKGGDEETHFSSRLPASVLVPSDSKKFSN